jgi:hypothetical protein
VRRAVTDASEGVGTSGASCEAQTCGIPFEVLSLWDHADGRLQQCLHEVGLQTVRSVHPSSGLSEEAEQRPANIARLVVRLGSKRLAEIPACLIAGGEGMTTTACLDGESAPHCRRVAFRPPLPMCGGPCVEVAVAISKLTDIETERVTVSLHVSMLLSG